MDLSVRKLLRPGQTGWLSFALAFNRVLELWNPLLQFFKDEKEGDLIQIIEDKTIKVYLEFLKVYLEQFNQVSLYFQQDVGKVFRIFNQITKFYLNLADDILLRQINHGDTDGICNKSTRSSTL
jgi:hypothetical protein